MTDHILVPRAVLQAAVDALSSFDDAVCEEGRENLLVLLDAPCEPVAWLNKRYGHMQISHEHISENGKAGYNTNGQWIKLYAPKDSI